MVVESMFKINCVVLAVARRPIGILISFDLAYTIDPPLLATIAFYDGGAVDAVELAIDPPLLATVASYESGPIIAVASAVDVPPLVIIAINDSRPAYAV